MEHSKKYEYTLDRNTCGDQTSHGFASSSSVCSILFYSISEPLEFRWIMNIRSQHLPYDLNDLLHSHTVLQVVDLLIASGADVQHLDQDGRTSLGLACLTGNVDIVKTFLEMGMCDIMRMCIKATML